MKKFIAYSHTTGEFTAWGEIEDFISFPELENSTSIEVDELPDNNTQYWSAGYQDRPIFTDVISATQVQLGTDVTISNLPSDTKVVANNILFQNFSVQVPVISGIATLQFSQPGNYAVFLTLWPYQHKTYNIEVTL